MQEVDISKADRDQLIIARDTINKELARRSTLQQATPPPPPEEPMHTFGSGAKRSEKIAARYDLIPSGPLRRLALRYGLGASRYGEYNWQKGLPLSDTYNHILAHLNNFRDAAMHGCDTEDDELAGAAWGIFTLMFFQDRGDFSTGNTNQLLGVEKQPQWDNPQTNRDAVKEQVRRIARESLEKMKAQDHQRLSGGSGPTPVDPAWNKATTPPPPSDIRD
jgi:hypothetical protein